MLLTHASNRREDERVKIQSVSVQMPAILNYNAVISESLLVTCKSDCFTSNSRRLSNRESVFCLHTIAARDSAASLVSDASSSS